MRAPVVSTVTRRVPAVVTGADLFAVFEPLDRQLLGVLDLALQTRRLELLVLQAL